MPDRPWWYKETRAERQNRGVFWMRERARWLILAAAVVLFLLFALFREGGPLNPKVECSESTYVAADGSQVTERECIETRSLFP